MENKDCTVLARPMYKRRKISAVRDFPEGCGPFASRIDPVLKVDVAGSSSENVTIVEDKNGEHLEGDTVITPKCEAETQHSESKDDPFLTETLGQTIDYSLKKNVVVSGHHVDGPPLPNDEPAKVQLVGMEALEDVELNTTAKSVRCESSYVLVSSSPVDEVVLSGSSKSLSSYVNLADSSACLEKAVTRRYFPRRKVSAVRDFPPLCGRNAPRLSQDECSKGISSLENKSMGQQNLAVDDKPLKNVAATSVKEMEKTVQDEYACKGTLVDRDIPPLCGRNAPHLSKDEFPKGISSLENKSTGQHNMESMSQQNLAVNDKPLKNVAATNVKEVEKTVQNEYALKGTLVDIVQNDSEENATEKVKKLNVSKPSSGMKSPLENTIENYITLPKENDHHQVETNCKTVVKEGNGDAVHAEGTSGKEVIVYQGAQSLGMKSPVENTIESFIILPKESDHHQVETNSKTIVKEGNEDAVLAEGTSGKEIIVYQEVQSLETKPLDLFGCQHELEGGFNGLQVVSDRTTVLGLMSKSECPWRQDKGSSKSNLHGGTNERKGKKVDFFARLERSKAAIKTKCSPNHYGKKPLKTKKGHAASDGMGQVVIWEKKDSLDPNENIEEFQVVRKSHAFNVNVPPIGHRNSSGHDNDSNMTRNKVRETLRLFQAVSRKLLQEVEASSKEQANGHRRIDLQAAKILKEKGKYVNTGKQILGSVPGVEVGDEFQYRVELNIIGVHRQIQGGIDYVKHNGKILATSIVASGGYADELDDSDVLIYTGQGGNVMNTGKEPEDQKLERGNLALKNSSEEKNPVRVILGSESMDGKFKTYVYDGLYVVERCWQDIGSHGKLVFRFRLRRIPGQPELALKEVTKSKKFKTREGLCVDDISHGKERIPICAVNTIDDEKPPAFKYITSMIYPDWCHPIPPERCGCTYGCSDSQKCSCVVKNGGEIPFNHNGAIVEAKPLVYECGPSCKCPSTCHNRVSQHGIKFQLEIFKTNSRGWGVRSLNFIPSGSFICEYIGELLEEKEAERRTGNDEYLFDIGNNYSNSTLWDGLSTLIPDAQSSSCGVVKDGGFTIDAAQYGNVGRFINHSCSPNLYAQNVLYDHHDNRIPHIMFFAAENIPPLQELTYDYNYMIDQVRDFDGNIKRKDCYCGSAECTGRMY